MKHATASRSNRSIAEIYFSVYHRCIPSRRARFQKSRSNGDRRPERTDRRRASPLPAMAALGRRASGARQCPCEVGKSGGESRRDFSEPRGEGIGFRGLRPRCWFFGLPQERKKIYRMRRERALFVIDDRALSLHLGGQSRSVLLIRLFRAPRSPTRKIEYRCPYAYARIGSRRADHRSATLCSIYSRALAK